MLARERAAVTNDDICSFGGEIAILGDALFRDQIEINARMKAALAKVSVESAGVAVLFQQLAEITQIIPHALRRNGRILPAFPGVAHAGDDGGAAEARSADFPHAPFILPAVVTS